MPPSATSAGDTSAVEFVRDRAEASPFDAQLYHFASHHLPLLLRFVARSLYRLWPHKSNPGVAEPSSVRLSDLQRSPDALRDQSTMLYRTNSDRSDSGQTCFWHVQSQEIDVRISQSFDEGSDPVYAAEFWYHECRIMTLGALDCRLEMVPSPLTRPLIFDEFVNQLTTGFDERHDGLALCRQIGLSVSGRSAPHPVVGNVFSQ
jgi:hypothetical protein